MALQSRTLWKRRISANIKTSLRNTTYEGCQSYTCVLYYTVFRWCFLIACLWFETGQSRLRILDTFNNSHSGQGQVLHVALSISNNHSMKGFQWQIPWIPHSFSLLPPPCQHRNSCVSKPYITVLYRAIAMFVTHFNYHFHPEHCPRKASQMYSDTLDKAIQCVTVICGFRIVKWSSNNFSISPNDIRTPSIVRRKRWK